MALAGCLSSTGDGAEGDEGKSGDAFVLEVPLFEMKGAGCKELLLQASVPLAAAREFVPAHYAIQGEATGRAVAFVALKTCDDLLLDDASAGPASTSDVGVLLDSPDGSEGIHYYQAWWITDNAALWSRLQAMGWRGGLVPDTALEPALVGGVAGPATLRVPWSEGAYAADATLGAATIPPGNLAVGWQDTPLGTARVIKSLASTSLGGGAGTITADDGSPASKLLGGTAARGPALWNEYDMDGVVVLGEWEGETS